MVLLLVSSIEIACDAQTPLPDGALARGHSQTLLFCFFTDMQQWETCNSGRHAQAVWLVFGLLKKEQRLHPIHLCGSVSSCFITLRFMVHP